MSSASQEQAVRRMQARLTAGRRRRLRGDRTVVRRRSSCTTATRTTSPTSAPTCPRRTSRIRSVWPNTRRRCAEPRIPSPALRRRPTRSNPLRTAARIAKRGRRSRASSASNEAQRSDLACSQRPLRVFPTQLGLVEADRAHRHVPDDPHRCSVRPRVERPQDHAAPVLGRLERADSHVAFDPDRWLRRRSCGPERERRPVVGRGAQECGIGLVGDADPQRVLQRRATHRLRLRRRHARAGVAGSGHEVIARQPADTAQQRKRQIEPAVGRHGLRG